MDDYFHLQKNKLTVKCKYKGLEQKNIKKRIYKPLEVKKHIFQYLKKYWRKIKNIYRTNKKDMKKLHKNRERNS